MEPVCKKNIPRGASTKPEIQLYGCVERSQPPKRRNAVVFVFGKVHEYGHGHGCDKEPTTIRQIAIPTTSF